MFLRGDFSRPNQPQTTPNNDRRIGALALLAMFILGLIVSLRLDYEVFTPFNATFSVTQTWRADHPQTATARPPARITRTPIPTATRNYEQQANLPDRSSPQHDLLTPHPAP